MKDAIFVSNNKLFAEVELIKKQIREQIRGIAINSEPSPMPNQNAVVAHNIALQRICP